MLPRRRIFARLALLALAGLLAIPALVLAQGLAGQRVAVTRRYPEVRWVETATLARWMDGAEAGRLVLLDAREPAEFSVSHLAGARRIAPEATSFEGLHLAANARVVVYCSVGWRSGAIADRLRRGGQAEVYNLEGGIFKWANEDRELKRDGARGHGEQGATRVHPYDAIWGRMLDSGRRAPLP